MWESFSDRYKLCTKCGSELVKEEGRKISVPKAAGRRAIPPLVWGCIMLSIGLFMITSTFFVVSEFVRGDPALISYLHFIWICIMLFISVFLTLRGIKLIRE